MNSFPLFLVLMSLPQCSHSEFNISPSNMTCPEGAIAVFRCQHQSPEADTNWSVNGSQPAPSSDIERRSINEAGSAVYILTIRARLEYDGTEVVCLAFFRDGTPAEISRTVVLTVTSEPIIMTSNDTCYNDEMVNAMHTINEAPTSATTEETPSFCVMCIIAAGILVILVIVVVVTIVVAVYARKKRESNKKSRQLNPEVMVRPVSVVPLYIQSQENMRNQSEECMDVHYTYLAVSKDAGGGSKPREILCGGKNKDAASPTPFTLGDLLIELSPHTSKWQSLGEALSLDEDRLDEIFTNNHTDEVCLQVMLELYLARPDLDHSWEAIHEAVKRIEEANKMSTPNKQSPPLNLEVSYGDNMQQVAKGLAFNVDDTEILNPNPGEETSQPESGYCSNIQCDQSVAGLN